MGFLFGNMLWDGLGFKTAERPLKDESWKDRFIHRQSGCTSLSAWLKVDVSRPVGSYCKQPADSTGLKTSTEGTESCKSEHQAGC